MQSFFYLVLSHPAVRERLVAEVLDATARGALPPAGNLSWAEAQNLPFFQACLKEAMRLRPAVGLNITRMVPPEGADLDGHRLAGGTRVAVNGWVLHRDRSVFGEDADVYRPDRWLEDEERGRRMERYMFQVSFYFRSLFFPCNVFCEANNHSSAAAPTSASAGTSPSSRSTRSSRASSATSTSSSSTRRGRCV